MTFLEEMKVKAEAKAVQMAKLELSVWNDGHEQELKQHFGFNDKSLAARKRQLTKMQQSSDESNRN